MASTLCYIHTDHLNTPRVISNSAAQIVWRWDNMDPFGYNAPNENPSGLGNFTCNLRLPGQYFDKETNLHYNYFRDYDPLTGRYVQSDPIGLAGGINTYVYTNNPLTEIDPFGLMGFGGGGSVGQNKTAPPSKSSGMTCDPTKAACLAQCMLENQTVCVPVGMGAGTIVGGTTAAVIACLQPELAYPTFVLVNAGVTTASTLLCNQMMRQRCTEKCGGGIMSVCSAK